MFRAEDVKRHAKIQASNTVNRVEASRQENRNDLRVPLLTPHFTEASRRLMAGMPDADVASYDCLKTALLREHRLTTFTDKISTRPHVKQPKLIYSTVPI